ncbi:MAG: 4-hydroxy-tetrahydrodipicolinate synthase [Ignavibacteriales bacterium]|nr:4-hydroxy-tetrahydrodipicolinate synthase [Ignavibacteriales bacterium]
MKRSLLFRGTGTALITPFTNQNEVDEHAIKKLVDYQIRGGVEALLPTGTTGESVTLSDEEQARVVAIVVKQAKGRVKVIAGAGSNSTAKAVILAKQMLAEGADGILSVAPYYNKPTQEGFYQHYAAIASEIDAPIVMYNVPGRTSSNIEAATTLRLANEFPNIVGIKEASGNFGQIMEILRSRPKGFGVWSGDDAITLPLIALGADGVVSVVSNEIPKRFSTMVRLCLKGNFAQATKIHNQLLDLMNFNFIESSPIPVKAVLAVMGMIKEKYRLPLVPLNDRHRPMMKSILKELGLI